MHGAIFVPFLLLCVRDTNGSCPPEGHLKVAVRSANKERQNPIKGKKKRGVPIFVPFLLLLCVTRTVHGTFTATLLAEGTATLTIDKKIACYESGQGGGLFFFFRPNVYGIS
jgi:hypothetical protein